MGNRHKIEMTLISERVRNSRFTAAVLVIIILTGFDLITKDLSRTYWQSGGVSIVDPYVRFEYVRNYDSFIRLGQLISERMKQVIFSFGSLVVITILVYSAFRYHFSQSGLCATALIIAGLIGNTGERILLGYIIDFVHLSAGSFHFPLFNLADVYVYFGFAILAMEIIRLRRQRLSTRV